MAAVAIALGAQALLTALWHSPASINVGQDVALPILTTLVYAFVWADTKEDLPPNAAWERFFERVWAVIVIDFIIGVPVIMELLRMALGDSADPKALQNMSAVIVLALSLFFLFADASAVADDDLTVWSIIPLAFLRSLVISLHPLTLARVLLLISLEFALFFPESGLLFLLTKAHVPFADFWAEVPLATFLLPPFAALTLLVYQAAKVPGKQAS